MQSTKKNEIGRFFVPSLTLSSFSIWTIESLTGLFLIDVTSTFFGSADKVALASTSQLVTLSSVISIVFALILGILSIKYDHKKILLMGCFCVVLGIFGCFLAPNFIFMQIFFPIEGIGSTIIASMALTLVGECLVLSKRPKAIGWILSGSSSSGIIGSLIISLFFSTPGDWRSYLLFFALPISLLSLFAIYFGVPSIPEKQRNFGKKVYLTGYKKVFMNKSAASCLIGVMFRQAGFVWAAVYSATFFRIQFDLSLAFVAILGIIGSSLFALSQIVGGHLVQRFGRKRQLVITLIVSSPGLILIPFVANLWLVLILSWTGGFIYGMSFPANTSLILEQVPEFRGTMMSMSTIFVKFGMSLGTIIGGAVLIISGWTGLILAFATMQLIAAAVFLFFTRDPCRM